VSIVSARSVMNALDKTKYEIVPVLIAKDGSWPGIQTGVDVVFPLVHGTYGEDGCLQGYLELANVPYVGCGVLGSAVGMDKVIQKQILRACGIPIVRFVELRTPEWTNDGQLNYPLFTKPANAGSSVGVSKIKDQSQLENGIKQAFRYDTKILVEEGVQHAREIECAVLGNDDPKTSVLGEIKPSNEFYDYDAKYVDGASASIIPADLPSELVGEMQKMAMKTFRVLNCSGMARVDFLLNSETGEWVVNEVNTIPGFTSISMYPKLWESSGLPYPKLLDRLIELAEERHRQKASLETSYQPSKEWHKAS
jgi:D-alanine-D-alanine ligase